MTDFSLIPILKSEGWKVMSRSKMKSMKNDELIETIETLENNYGATIERANNSYSYGKSEIERLEKENEQLKADLDSYKAFDSHYDEIEEDAKWIAEENAKLKADLEEAQKHCKAVDDVNAKLRCCGNCKHSCSTMKCFNCVDLSNWEMKE